MTAGAFDGAMTAAGTEVRRIAGGDATPVPVLRDLIFTCLRHDALHDLIVERLDLLARMERLDLLPDEEEPDLPRRLAGALPDLIDELLRSARYEDWVHVAAALTDAYHDAAGAGEVR